MGQPSLFLVFTEQTSINFRQYHNKGELLLSYCQKVRIPVVLTASAKDGGSIASDYLNSCKYTSCGKVAKNVLFMGNESNQKTTGEHEWQHIET